MKIASFAYCAIALATSAHAQDVLLLNGGEGRWIEAACVSTGTPCTHHGSPDRFMEDLAAREWKLVIVEWYLDLSPAQKARLLPALRAHLDRAGRLLIVYTHLDEWPELQELIDVRTTGDIGPVFGRRIWSVDPAHPTWIYDKEPLFADPTDCFQWTDNGDYLGPGASAYVIAEWDDAERSPAFTISRNGRVMTAGFTYDAFCGYSWHLAEEQILWLLTCQPDLDGDGELTFFDFLAFQDLFIAGDMRADFAFDGKLDFFDFLEFQNQFAVGCP